MGGQMGVVPAEPVKPKGELLVIASPLVAPTKPAEPSSGKQGGGIISEKSGSVPILFSINSLVRAKPTPTRRRIMLRPRKPRTSRRKPRRSGVKRKMVQRPKRNSRRRPGPRRK